MPAILNSDQMSYEKVEFEKLELPNDYWMLIDSRDQYHRHLMLGNSLY